MAKKYEKAIVILRKELQRLIGGQITAGSEREKVSFYYQASDIKDAMKLLEKAEA